MEWLHIASLVTVIEGGKEADLCSSAENQDEFYMHYIHKLGKDSPMMTYLIICLAKAPLLRDIQIQRRNWHVK